VAVEVVTLVPAGVLRLPAASNPDHFVIVGGSGSQSAIGVAEQRRGRHLSRLAAESPPGFVAVTPVSSLEAVQVSFADDELSALPARPPAGSAPACRAYPAGKATYRPDIEAATRHVIPLRRRRAAEPRTSARSCAPVAKVYSMRRGPPRRSHEASPSSAAVAGV